MKIVDLMELLRVAQESGVENVEFVSEYYQVEQEPDIYQPTDISGNPSDLLRIIV